MYCVVRVFHRSQIPILHQMRFVSIFSESLGRPFTLSVASFETRQSFISVKFSVSVFSVTSVVGVLSKKPFPSPGPPRFTLMFSPKSFSGLGCYSQGSSACGVDVCMSCGGSPAPFSRVRKPRGLSTGCRKDYSFPIEVSQYHC